MVGLGLRELRISRDGAFRRTRGFFHLVTARPPRSPVCLYLHSILFLLFKYTLSLLPLSLFLLRHCYSRAMFVIELSLSEGHRVLFMQPISRLCPDPSSLLFQTKLVITHTAIEIREALHHRAIYACILIYALLCHCVNMPKLPL